MDELWRAMMELGNRSGKEGYSILYLAVQEAWKHQPKTISMGQLCMGIMKDAGKNSPKTVYRSLVRAVDDIWEGEASRAAASRWCGSVWAEKPTPKDLVFALARSMWGRYGSFPVRRRVVHYQVFEAVGAESYGILACDQEPVRWVATGAFSKDRESLESFVQSLNQKQVPLEEFKSQFLTGGLLEGGAV